MILLTVSEAMALFNIKRSSLYALINLGMPSARIPRVGRRIYRDQALAWLVQGGPGLALEKMQRKAAKELKKSMIKQNDLAGPVSLIKDNEPC